MRNLTAKGFTVIHSLIFVININKCNAETNSL